MKGEFVFLIDGKLKTFYDYRDIPKDFDHVIKFVPDVPPGPHSHDQHEEMEKWTNLLQEVVAREKTNHGRLYG
jgi:hypothetical protein